MKIDKRKLVYRNAKQGNVYQICELVLERVHNSLIVKMHYLKIFFSKYRLVNLSRAP